MGKHLRRLHLKTESRLLLQRHSLLVLPVNEVLVDVRDNATPGDRGLNQRVEFLVSADSKLQMAWCDTLHA